MFCVDGAQKTKRPGGGPGQTGASSGVDILFFLFFFSSSGSAKVLGHMNDSGIGAPMRVVTALGARGILLSRQSLEYSRYVTLGVQAA